MITLQDLHDATLVEMKIDWEAGVLYCTFRVMFGEKHVVKIIASGLTYFLAPKLSPWGPSNSVNAINTTQRGSNYLLTIEMQSGDLIHAHVNEIVIE